MLLIQTAFRLVIRPILLGFLADIRKAGVEIAEVRHVKTHGVTAKSCQSRHGILLACHDIRITWGGVCFVLSTC